MVEQRNIHKSWEPILERHKAEDAHKESREAVRDSVVEHIEEAKKQHAIASVTDDDTASTATSTDTHAKALSALEEPDQVAFLGKIALEQGVAKAVAIAEKSGSPYVIDALHDLLVDELSQELAHRSN